MFKVTWEGGAHTVRKSGREVRTADRQIEEQVYDEVGTLPTGLKKACPIGYFISFFFFLVLIGGK